MKKTLFFNLLVLSGFVLNSCAHSTIPQIQIPEQKGELDVAASLGIGTSGLHANAIYALSDKICLQGATNFLGTTFYREAGLGLKTRAGKRLWSFTYGRAEYRYNPLVYGGTYGIYEYTGHFDKYAAALNVRFSPEAGLVGRLAYLNGRETGENECLVCRPYYHLPFSRLYFEPVVYFKLGKRKRLLLSATGRLQLSAKGKTDKDYAFAMSYFQYNVGYMFGMFKKPRLE
ncbi:MAG: hypothetical protein WCR52_05545 [Bacteroidota bacterium]